MPTSHPFSSIALTRRACGSGSLSPPCRGPAVWTVDPSGWPPGLRLDRLLPLPEKEARHRRAGRSPARQMVLPLQTRLGPGSKHLMMAPSQLRRGSCCAHQRIRARRASSCRRVRGVGLTAFAGDEAAATDRPAGTGAAVTVRKPLRALEHVILRWRRVRLGQLQQFAQAQSEGLRRRELARCHILPARNEGFDVLGCRHWSPSQLRTSGIPLLTSGRRHPAATAPNSALREARLPAADQAGGAPCAAK